MSYVPRLKSEYKERVISALTEEFSYKNVMQVPKLEKIVISKGVGAAVADKKLIDHALEEVTKNEEFLKQAKSKIIDWMYVHHNFNLTDLNELKNKIRKK